MAPERQFTVEEAQALLDAELRAEAERMVEVRARGRDLEGRWRRLVIAIGSNGGNFEKPEVRKLRAELKQAAEDLAAILGRFEDHGVQVKDADAGLIDFPAEIGGEPASPVSATAWRAMASAPSPARIAILSAPRSRPQLAGPVSAWDAR